MRDSRAAADAIGTRRTRLDGLYVRSGTRLKRRNQALALRTARLGGNGWRTVFAYASRSNAALKKHRRGTVNERKSESENLGPGGNLAGRLATRRAGQGQAATVSL